MITKYLENLRRNIVILPNQNMELCEKLNENAPEYREISKSIIQTLAYVNARENSEYTKENPYYNGKESSISLNGESIRNAALNNIMGGIFGMYCPECCRLLTIPYSVTYFGWNLENIRCIECVRKYDKTGRTINGDWHILTACSACGLEHFCGPMYAMANTPHTELCHPCYVKLKLNKSQNNESNGSNGIVMATRVNKECRPNQTFRNAYNVCMGNRTHNYEIKNNSQSITQEVNQVMIQPITQQTNQIETNKKGLNIVRRNTNK